MSIAELLHKNIDQRKLLKIATDLGCRVEKIRRHGEIKIMHPLFGRSFKVNCRRQDSPQNLIAALRQLATGTAQGDRRAAAT